MSSRSLRILCFGDSLTSGYCAFGTESHPYSLRLEDRLYGALPRDTHIEVFTSGVPGDLVTNTCFKDRLDVELGKRTYDWVIILGGTNDIGRCMSGEDTFQALQERWHAVLAKGSKVLALTVPECAAKVGWLDEARDELNESIRAHKERNFYVFDLKAHIPYHSLTEDQRDDLWDDGLHMTPAGYNRMGQHIADALIRLIQQEEEQQAKAKSRVKGPVAVKDEKPVSEEESGNAKYQEEQQTKAKPRPRKSVARKDDKLVFDEESGDTKNISQGYVVVRKRDLE